MVEKLRAIAQGSRRSKTARLREIFEEVEAAKTNGASNKEIVAGLAEHNLIFDVPNFKNARSRILKERAMEALAKAATGVNEVQSSEFHGLKNSRRSGDLPRVLIKPVVDENKNQVVKPVAAETAAKPEITVLKTKVESGGVFENQEKRAKVAKELISTRTSRINKS